MVGPRLVGITCAAALLCTLEARGEAPTAFAKLRDRAQPVESLSAFVDRFVGNCPDMLERATCRANAKKARREMTGKLYYVILDDAASRMLRAGPYNPATRQFQIDLTPFFDAGGLALTDGAPKGQDEAGRPRIPLMPLLASLPPDWMPMDMERLLRTQNVRIHLVFKPLDLWSLPSKDGKERIEGVKTKFLAVRLTDARTGDDLALRTAAP
jgi:hypothetical protein